MTTKTVSRVIARLYIICGLLLMGAVFAATARGAEALLEGEVILEDFDGMLERRAVRVLVVYNKMMYFLDGATHRGITFEAFEQFEQYLNKKHKFGARKLDMIYIPVPRDQLLPLLVEGYGDIAAANMTTALVTESRSNACRQSISPIRPIPACRNFW